MTRDIYNKKEGGYAILFTVVIISIISLIAVGLSNTNYKQLLLSSVAKDSQVAFYKSDTAIECALYADNVDQLDASYTGSWECGVDDEGNNYSLEFTPLVNINGGSGFDLSPSNPNSEKPCFNISIVKDPLASSTVAYGRGYSSCDQSGLRTVEREIQVTY